MKYQTLLQEGMIHFRVNEPTYSTYWKSLNLILGMSGYVMQIFLEKIG